MIDVLFVFPPGGIIYRNIFSYNLGSGYIIGYLRENGFTAEQFITSEPFNVKTCAKEIIKFDPKIIGFTVYYPNFMQSVLLSEELKKMAPNKIIIFGGPTPSVQDEYIIKNIKSVDICVRGAGEETLHKLLLKLKANGFKISQKFFKEVMGITFRENNLIIKTEDSNHLLKKQSVRNILDTYPSPYLEGIIPISEAYYTGIITARGCNQNCVYCNCAMLSNKQLFFHSIDRVIEELSLISKIGNFKAPIPIYDDTFTIIPSRAKKICELIIEKGLNLKLGCVTRCDKITEELLDLMKQAGFVSLGVSLESAVPRVLRAIGKVNPPMKPISDGYEEEINFIKQVDATTSYAKKIGFNHVFVSIMVGLPTETLKDIETTLDFIKGLKIDAYQHNFFKIYKGTPIFKGYKQYGYKIRPISEKNQIITNMFYPFDVYQVKLAEKSLLELLAKTLDYKTMKILTFNPKRTTMKNFFNNAIILTNKITKSMVKWLQSNLSINGYIIHIYSDKNSFLLYENDNRNLLFGEFSPSYLYETYFFEQNSNCMNLVAGRTIKVGDNISLSISLLGCHNAIYMDDTLKDLSDVICLEYSQSDSESVYNYLNDLYQNKVDLNSLIDHKILPFFQNLCKWTRSSANCLTFDTVILGSNGSIRICWFGDTIGNINQDFSHIENHLNYLRKETQAKRNCMDCSVNDECVKCLFTNPLSPEMYCEMRKKGNTVESVRLIGAYNVLKDLVFKPNFHISY